MFENLHLLAIVQNRQGTRILRVPLHNNLQQSLSENWHKQYQTFLDDIQEVDFNAGYSPEENEKFCLRNFHLPFWLSKENIQTVRSLDSISNDDAAFDSIKGLVAYVHNQMGTELILFQNFNRSYVIRPGYFIFLEAGTYQTADHPGLTLENKLSAIFFPDEEKLLFHNFRNVNTFLPLSDYYQEASEDQIRDILNHDRLDPEDIDSLATDSNQWFRKRFAMLKDSGILDRHSTHQIVKRARKYNLEINLNRDRIIFPAKRGEAKRLLQFLNEEIFRGAITRTIYETNSKKEAG